LSRLSNAKTRSISAENFTGEKGKAGMATEGTGAVAGRELGQGWKISPSIHVPGNTTVTLAEIQGPAAIQHIWNTVAPRQWRRNNPLPYMQDHTILDGIRGQGHYVGTYLAWGVNNTGWWGEGEIKFFMDGDGEFPTICGTGTEDYFGGAWDFEWPIGQYGV